MKLKRLANFDVGKKVTKFAGACLHLGLGIVQKLWHTLEKYTVYQSSMSEQPIPLKVWHNLENPFS